MQEIHGKRPFDIIPDSYVLPEEYSDFYNHFMQQQTESPYKNIWISKPSQGRQGKGIFITDNINDIDPDED